MTDCVAGESNIKKIALDCISFDLFRLATYKICTPHHTQQLITVIFCFREDKKSSETQKLESIKKIEKVAMLKQVSIIQIGFAKTSRKWPKTA